MSADSRLLVQAVREGINREHLLLNDVDGQLGWSRDKTKNVFSGRTLNGIACSCGSYKLCSRRRKTGNERDHRTVACSRLRAGDR